MTNKGDLINTAFRIINLKWELAFEKYKAAKRKPHTEIEQARAEAEGNAYTMAKLIIADIAFGDADDLNETYEKLVKEYREKYGAK